MHYILSDRCIESQSNCINNSGKTEDLYREVKETLCLWPYACVAWRYIDPINEKNKRYIQMITENFDAKAMQTLA